MGRAGPNGGRGACECVCSPEGFRNCLYRTSEDNRRSAFDALRELANRFASSRRILRVGPELTGEAAVWDAAVVWELTLELK